MKTRTRNRLYDIVQRTWVYTCMGVTATCAVYIGYELFNYFVYVKPLKKEAEEQFKRELLKEGMLKDRAPISQASI